MTEIHSISGIWSMPWKEVVTEGNQIQSMELNADLIQQDNIKNTKVAILFCENINVSLKFCLTVPFDFCQTIVRIINST